MTIVLILAGSAEIARKWAQHEKLPWQCCRYVTEPYQVMGYDPATTYVVRLYGWMNHPVAWCDEICSYQEVITCLATHAQENAHGLRPRFLSSMIAKHGDQDEA